jgi:hypothetical protein
MADKLTWRNSGTLILIYFGLAQVVVWLVMLVTRWLVARNSGGDIQAVAEATSLSLKGMAVGMVIAAIGFALRLVLKPR